MTKKVLTIGGAVRDLFLEYDNPFTITHAGRTYIAFEEGRKLEVANLLAYVGGGAANAAVSFKRLNCDAQAFFKVGNDPDGEYIKRTLQQQGIKTDHVVISDTMQTGISCIVPTSSGNRTVLVYRGATATLQTDEIPFSAIDMCDQLYVTSLSDASSLQLLPIVTRAKKHKKSVAVNPGGSQLRARVDILCKALSHIDIFILNSLEAKQLMYGFIQEQVMPEKELVVSSLESVASTAPTLLNTVMEYKQKSFSLRTYFKAIVAQGPHTVVVTDGANGVYVAHENSIYFYPSSPIKVISSVGAGDAFGSTFVALRAQGKSVEDALMGGIINASSVISSVGSQTGLLSLADLEKRLMSADRGLLQKYAL
jgi:sugar/nucleoside kinase (ribokinase family)